MDWRSPPGLQSNTQYWGGSPPDPRGPRLWSGWSVHLHETHGIPYYFHEATQTSVWERPSCVPDDAVPENAPGVTVAEYDSMFPLEEEDEAVENGQAMAHRPQTPPMTVDPMHMVVATLDRVSEAEVRAIRAMQADRTPASSAREEEAPIRYVDHHIDASYGIPGSRSASNGPQFSSSLSDPAQQAARRSPAQHRAHFAADMHADSDVSLVDRMAVRIQSLYTVFCAVRELRRRKELQRARRERAEAEERLRRLQMREMATEQQRRAEAESTGRSRTSTGTLDEVQRLRAATLAISVKQSSHQRTLTRTVRAFQTALRRRMLAKHKAVFDELVRHRAAAVIQRHWRWARAVRGIAGAAAMREIVESRAAAAAAAAAAACERAMERLERAAMRREQEAVAAAAAAKAREESERLERERRAAAWAKEMQLRELAQKQEAEKELARAADMIKRAYRNRPSRTASMIVQRMREHPEMTRSSKRLRRLFRFLRAPGETSLSKQRWLQQTTSKSAAGVTESTRDILSLENKRGSGLSELAASASAASSFSSSASAAAAAAAAGGLSGQQGNGRPQSSSSLRGRPPLLRASSAQPRAGSASNGNGGVAPRLGSLGRSSGSAVRLSGPAASMRRASAGAKASRRRSTIGMDLSVKIFNQIDEDGSQSIEEEEFVAFFRGDIDDEMQTWLTNAVIELDSLDLDREARTAIHRGRLERAVRPACHDALALRTAELAGHFFDICDEAGGGEITSRSFTNAFQAGPSHQALSQETALKIFQRIDEDGSGTIDRSEFINGSMQPANAALQAWLVEYFAAARQRSLRLLVPRVITVL